jgi:hypothetical protein
MVTVLLEKLTGLQLVKKFLPFYGTRKSAFKIARHLSYPEPVPSNPYTPIPLPEVSEMY